MDVTLKVMLFCGVVHFESVKSVKNVVDFSKILFSAVKSRDTKTTEKIMCVFFVRSEKE